MFFGHYKLNGATTFTLSNLNINEGLCVRRIMRKISFMIIWFLFLAGCATNPFSEYYKDQTGGVDLSSYPMVIIPVGNPKIYSGNSVDADSQKMLEDGYLPLGFSSFNAGNINEGELIEQAKKVKAEVVIFYSQYTHTISGSMPLVLPDTKTITTNSSGTSFNSGSIYGYGRGYDSYSGTGSYSGSSTSTIYGTKTTYIPYSQTRYAYFATFWIKTKKPIFGTMAFDLSSDLREKIGSNKGVLVFAVMKESPAFMSDILKNDIIRKLNGSEVINTDTFYELLGKFKGQTITVELLRNGKKTIKWVKLND